MRNRKKRTRIAFFATKFTAALLCLLLLFSLFGCKRGSDVPLSDGLSLIEGEPIYDSDVAMQTDHFTVTPGMMAFFFYSYGGELLVEMEKTVPFDSSKTLHEQIFRDELTFYDVLMNSTLQKVSEMLIYCEAAKEAGVTLTAEQKTAIASEITALRMDAATNGMEADPYLQRFYGPLMTVQDLQSVYECEALATAYSATVTDELEGAITEDRIEGYVRDHGLSDKTPSRNIAYLAIPYAAGVADESKVSTVLAALQNAPKLDTLQGFSSMGSFGSEQDLAPENTGVSAISEWLFAGGRAVGDYGRVEAGGATYILIYTDNGMSYAEVSARMSLYDAAYADWYNGWVERLTFGYNYDILDSYDIT